MPMPFMWHRRHSIKSCSALPMNLRSYLNDLFLEPVQLSAREKCIGITACLIAILLTGFLTQTYAIEHAPILVASMGASAVILFVLPSSPLAQPWPFVGGQMIPALIGILCAFYIADTALAAALSVGLAVAAMLSFRCLHPPGAATALAPILSNPHLSAADFNFLLQPMSINVLLMLTLSLIINKGVLHRNYPTRPIKAQPGKSQDNSPGKLIATSQSDIEQAMQSIDHAIDISSSDLLQLLTQLHLQNVQKKLGPLHCGEIMQTNIVTVEYATEIESAWIIMQEQHLTVLPVLDRAHRVIGIVTRHDFLKNLKLTPYENFQDKWLKFIQRSPTLHSDKPEAIGHIMTREVKTLSIDTPITALIPLVVNEGHHHVPIVDQERRFAGIVFQSRLVSALFNQLVTMPD